MKVEEFSETFGPKEMGRVAQCMRELARRRGVLPADIMATTVFFVFDTTSPVALQQVEQLGYRGPYAAPRLCVPIARADVSSVIGEELDRQSCFRPGHIVFCLFASGHSNDEFGLAVNHFSVPPEDLEPLVEAVS